MQADVSERSTSSDPDAHRAQGVVGIGEASLPRRLRRVLSTEINRNMGLLGINSLAEMRPELLLLLRNEPGSDPPYRYGLILG